MIENLFGSKTRVKLLQLFYSNPSRSYYVREITRKIDEQINSVRRELANLLSIGIISSDSENNKLYYEVNQKYEFFNPLREIFSDDKSNATISQSATNPGQTTALPKNWQHVGKVDLLIYTGQFTRDERSGTDIVVIGDVNPSQVAHAVHDIEEQEGKELRYTVIGSDEWSYREEVNDRFWSQVQEAKKIIIFKAEPATEE